MDHPSEEVRTALIDLTETSFESVRAFDRNLLAPSLDRLLRQIERPRVNIGGSGPPGRVD